MIENALFQLGSFTLASGQKTNWKIECDSLLEEDWVTVAYLLSNLVQPFGAVEGVPRGGLVLAKCMQRYVTEGKLLIVDDVWTTGSSWLKYCSNRPAFGAVVFARGLVPENVTALWSMPIRSL